MHAFAAVSTSLSRPAAFVAVRRPSPRRRFSTRTRAAAGPITVTVVKGGASMDVPGDGGTVGASASCDATVGGDGVDDEHAKLEVRQGRIFVTALSRTAGTFLGGNRLFPGVAYPVPEGATVRLGDADAAITVSQADGGAGTEGVDMMSKMMQMQFEATMDPEVKKALED